MINVYHYKHVIDGEVVSYEVTENENLSEGYIEIPEDEYKRCISELTQSDETSKTADDYIAELRAENMALSEKALPRVLSYKNT